MVRPRSTSSTKRTSAQWENPSALSSEVLKLRFQALNLRITGSRGQLLARLRTTLPGNTSKTSVRTQKQTSLGAKAVQTCHRRANQAADRQQSAHVHHRVQSRTKTNEKATPSLAKLPRPQSTKYLKATYFPVSEDTKFSPACHHRGDRRRVNQQRFGRLVSAENWFCSTSNRVHVPRNCLPFGYFKAGGTQFGGEDTLRKPRRTQTLCFDVNNSSGCKRRNGRYPHVCRRCYSSNHSTQSCSQQSPSNTGTSKSFKSSERGKK